MRDSFSALHPAINFFFFAAVLLITMLVMHPVFLLLSLLSGALYAVYLNGRRALRFQLCAVLPMILLMAVLNPLFNHAGVTILFYLSNGNPVTLEAVSYGLAAAVMFAAVILWFSCYNKVMTSDKFLYLFGKVIPSISLLLSMALRFVPRFKEQITHVALAQRALGRDMHNGGFFKRAGCAMRILSITVTWALENAVNTADSMRSRGYGLKGRTVYSIYRFDHRDRWLTGCMVLLAAGFLAGLVSGQVHVSYFPYLSCSGAQPIPVTCYVLFGLFCNIPMILNWKEDYTWRVLQSKI